MAAAYIPAKTGGRHDFAFAGPLSRGDGMIDMPSQISHLPAYASGALAAVGGLVAYVDGQTDVGGLGAIIGGGGFAGLIYFVVRDLAPKAIDTIPILLSNRATSIRTDEQLKGLRVQHEATLEELRALKVRLAEAEQEARDAKNLIENAKIEADARADAIDEKARKAVHLANNNAQRLDIADQRLDDVEKVMGGSGDRDPESAI